MTPRAPRTEAAKQMLAQYGHPIDCENCYMADELRLVEDEAAALAARAVPEAAEVMAVLEERRDHYRNVTDPNAADPVREWLFANGFAAAVEVARRALATEGEPQRPPLTDKAMDDWYANIMPRNEPPAAPASTAHPDAAGLRVDVLARTFEATEAWAADRTLLVPRGGRNYIAHLAAEYARLLAAGSGGSAGGGETMEG